jgi:hypothetical protein
VCHGKADILWYHDTQGWVHIWRMNGTSIAETRTIATIPLQWKIEGMGDYNGDGKADILPLAACHHGSGERLADERVRVYRVLGAHGDGSDLADRGVGLAGGDVARI